MHVVEIRDLDGPNVFLLKPAIKVEFRSENKADELATARRLDGGNDLGGSLLAVVDMLHERAGIEGVDVVVTPMELPGHLSVAFSWRNRRAGRLIGQAIAALAMGESIDIDAVAAEIADAIAQQLGPIEALPTTDPNAALAAFTMAGAAEAMNNMIEDGCKSSAVTEVTAKYRNGDRLIQKERCDYLRPTVLHVANCDDAMANTEFMFPFVSVVKCDQKNMLKKIGTTLVGTAITNDESWIAELVDARHIDRLNIGPVPTCALNWLQPHEGNIIDFLYRGRAFQNSLPPAH